MLVVLQLQLKRMPLSEFKHEEEEEEEDNMRCDLILIEKCWVAQNELENPVKFVVLNDLIAFPK